jgi:hypothetical protein
MRVTGKPLIIDFFVEAEDLAADASALRRKL